MNAVVSTMARAIHPHFDGEDEATAAICAAGVADWLGGSRAFEVAMSGIDDAMVEAGGAITYGDTARAVLAAIVAEVSA